MMSSYTNVDFFSTPTFLFLGGGGHEVEVSNKWVGNLSLPTAGYGRGLRGGYTFWTLPLSPRVNYAFNPLLG